MSATKARMDRVVAELRAGVTRRLCGRFLGHVPSWSHAVAIGITDRPICEVCTAELEEVDEM